MSTPIHRIVNVNTNQITEIKFSDNEIKSYAAEAKAEQAKLDEQAAIQIARNSAFTKLAALGLTTDEINGLIS